MTTLASYLLTRLKQIGVDHLFAVPGDFVLGFLNQVLKSELRYVGTCNELNAAYAADGYARIHGIGAFATTFGVGELSALNGVAGAFAEGVPVVAITGTPASSGFRTRPLLHHTLGDYQIPLKMYELITVASAQLDNAERAPAEIDRVLLACLEHQLPVYLSLPSDLVDHPCPEPGPFPFPVPRPSDPDALREALEESVALISQAALPIVIADGELARFHLQDALAALIARTGLPFVTRMLGKAMLSEHLPQFIGLFEGDRSRPCVRERIEKADCILQLGPLLTDLNTGGFSTDLPAGKTITAHIRTLEIGHHHYENVNLLEFMEGLTERLPFREPATLEIQSASAGCCHRVTAPYTPIPEAPLTIQRFFDRMSHFLAEDTVVLAETGVSLFSAAEMLMPPVSTFIGQTFYGSIGYTIGATLGACMAAPARPAVLFVGDGSFQVTGQDVSTMIRDGLKPVIFLMNNDGYTIERVITDHPYNDLQPWRYHMLPEVFGGGLGLEARTEGELEVALTRASAAQGLVFIEIHTGRLDCPESLRLAGQFMAKANHLDG